MFIETVPNRNSPPAVLLRETWREGGKVKKRTLLNLTRWPAEHVEGLRILLKGGTALPPGEAPFTIMRSLPHGHVAAILGTIRAIGLDRILGPDGNRSRDLVLAMIINRIIAPGSKLATARMLDEPTACTSAGKVLGLGAVDASELYEALDWLLVRQPDVEKKLARKHLKSKCLPDFDKQNRRAVAWCSTTSHRAMSKAAAAILPASATIATARRARSRLFTACCAPPMAAPWRSKYSRATPPIRKRSWHRSRN